MSLTNSLAALDLADARPRGRRSTLSLYLRNARPSFVPHPEADVATIAVPDGSAVLTTWGEAMLFVPTEARIRCAWTAREVWLAARMGERGFGIMSGPRRPKPEQRKPESREAPTRPKRKYRHTAAWVRAKAHRDRERLVAIRRMRREGMTHAEIGAELDLTGARVSQIWRADEMRRLTVGV